MSPFFFANLADGRPINFSTDPDGSGSLLRMSITGAGNVGIGDASPDGTLLLDVEGQVGATEFCDENGDNCYSTTDLAAAKSIDDLNDGKSDEVDDLFLGTGSGTASTGARNVGVGIGTLSATTGADNTAMGYNALASNTTADGNSAFGSNALAALLSGGHNTAVGTDSLASTTTGGGNTAIGYNALNSNDTALGNTAVGVAALRDSDGDENTAIGYGALVGNTSGIRNVAMGMNPLGSNLSGDNNIGLGYLALRANTTGSNNIGIGTNTLFDNEIGDSNIALGGTALVDATGSNNTALGYYSGHFTTTGNNNTYLGHGAGSEILSGSRNIVIGDSAQVQSAAADNQLSIGNLIYGTGLDQTGANISTGGIGISVLAPTAKLDIAGSINDEDSLRIRGGDTSTFGADSNQILFSYAGTTERTHAIKSRHSDVTNEFNALDFYVWDQGVDAVGDIGTEHVMTLSGGKNGAGGSVGIGESVPVTNLDINGGIALAIRTVTADITATVNDNMILCDAAAADVTVTLPDATGIDGFEVTVKKIDNSTNTCTIDGDAGDIIDGAFDQAISTQYDSYTVMSDGSVWWIK